MVADFSCGTIVSRLAPTSTKIKRQAHCNVTSCAGNHQLSQAGDLHGASEGSLCGGETTQD